MPEDVYDELGQGTISTVFGERVLAAYPCVPELIAPAEWLEWYRQPSEGTFSGDAFGDGSISMEAPRT